MALMKQLEFSQYRSMENLRIVQVPVPTPKEKQVLVNIHASSINSWDWELFNARPFVNRLMFGMYEPKKLKTLGIDVAGEVVEVGANVNKFKIGDAVYGDLCTCGWGGFAEYVAAPQDALALKPNNISFEQAAAIPQAGLLALQGLEKGQLKDGKKVLINGASGGSGSIAVQIAKTYNVDITATCSTAKMDFVASLGVDKVISYEQENFTHMDDRYDLILDAQARFSIFDYRKVLQPKGIYVGHGGASASIIQLMLLGPLLSMIGSKRTAILMHKANKGLEHMSKLLEEGTVSPNIDKVFPLSQIVEALKYYGDGKAHGKIVINTQA